uniref:Uncharacterized protein n=1 Tax=Strigamia maritima TaxID=126957 RepID=T1J7F7_STRMM
MILFADSEDTKAEILRRLNQRFDIVDLERVKSLLGVDFIHEADKVFMSQTNYILKLATSRTRPDILFSVIALSQYSGAHTSKHVKALLQVLQYVLNTANYRIELTQCSSDRVWSYSDASWASDPITSLSFGGFIVYLGSVPIVWNCKKQSSVACSTMEAEFVAMYMCHQGGICWTALLGTYLVPTLSVDGAVSLQHISSYLVAKKSNIDECKTPKESWDELQRIYETSSRAHHAVRNLKLFKEDINPQHHAYQYLDFLPEEYSQATFTIYHWSDDDFVVCLRPPRAFTRPKKYAEPRRRFRDVVRELKFTYVSQKPLVPHAAGLQREFPTSYRSKAPFGALLVFTLLRTYQLSRNSEITARYQARYEEHSQPIAGALRSIFRADFWVDRNRGNFWLQPGHRVPPSDLGFSIQNQNFQKLQKFDFHQFLHLYGARGSWPNIAKMSEKDITKSAASGIPKLDRTNYVQWCVDVQLLLEEKGIWSFAVGKQEEPPATASAQEKQKFAEDKAKARAIILQRLVPCLQLAAMKCEDTQAVWLHLKKLFEPSSIAREASLVETFYGIRRLENEELDTFISQLEKAEDDLIAAEAKLKPEDQIKAYILLSRVGKDFELQIQSIYQWQKVNFTYEKVQEALLLENNRRKLSEKSLETATAYSLSLKGHMYKTNSKVCSLYGKLEDGLYRIQGPVKYRQNNHSSLNKSGTRATEPSPTGKPENYSVSVNMWHQRFGHMYTKGY